MKYVILGAIVLVLFLPITALAETVIVEIPKNVPTNCNDERTCYNPYLVNINVGDTVVWQNKDVKAHTITSGNPTDGPDGLFDSGLVMGGESFSLKFEESQITAYFDMVNPWMQGIVRVTEDTSMEYEQTSQTESAKTTEEKQKTVMTTKTIRNPELETVNSIENKISRVLSNTDYYLDEPSSIQLDDGTIKKGFLIKGIDGETYGGVNIFSKNNYVVELELATSHFNDFESASIGAIILAGLIKGVMDPNEYDNDDFTEMYGEAAEDLDYETDSVRITPGGHKVTVSYITIVEGVPGLTMVTWDIQYKQEITEVTISTPKTVLDEPKNVEVTPSIDRESTESPTDNSDSGSAALGAFVVFGIPAIIIGLVIMRRKMKKREVQKIKDSEWKGV